MSIPEYTYANIEEFAEDSQKYHAFILCSDSKYQPHRPFDDCIDFAFKANSVRVRTEYPASITLRADDGNRFTFFRVEKITRQIIEGKGVVFTFSCRDCTSGAKLHRYTVGAK